MKFFQRLFKNRGFLIAAAVSLVMLILSYSAGLWLIMQSGLRTAEKSEAAVRIAFDRLNDIMRQAKGVIEANSDFFRDEYALNEYNDKFIKAVNSIKEIKSFCPYVEEVVFYQKYSQRMITTLGSITKEDFFKHAYETDAISFEYWNSIMDMYNTPTVVPVHEYTVLSQIPVQKKLFVVPQVYTLYNVGVLIFVNEQMFWKYCNPGGGEDYGEIALYNGEGLVTMSNYSRPEKFIDVSHLKGADRGNVNFWGRYNIKRYLNYEDLIFSFSTINSAFPISITLMIGFAVLITALSAWKGRALYNVGGKGAGFWEKLTEEMFGEEKELSYEYQEALNEVRILLTALSKKTVSNSFETAETAYWYEPSAELKLSMSKHIASQNVMKLCEEIKHDITRRIEQGITYNMLVYHMFDLYVTVACYMKDGEKFFEENYSLLSEGLTRFYLNADSEKMTNLLMNILRDSERFYEDEDFYKIKEVISYIDKNFTKALYLESVATEFSMVPNYFSRFFKKHTGIGFVEYLTKLRLEKAADLLTSTNITVKEISKAVGYAAGNTFNMAFKKYYGITPNEYRISRRN